jgi:hypothetical protein
MPNDLLQFPTEGESPLSEPEDQAPEKIYPQKLINAFRTIVTKIGNRDLISRRQQVKDAWKQRLFYRGQQRIIDAGRDGWEVPANSGVVANGVGGDSDDFRQIENIFLAYSQIIDAALTGSKPTCRFTPNNIDDPQDVSAADSADADRQLIERNNDIPTLQGDVARYLFTDGVSYYYSSWDETTQEERINAYGALECKRPIAAKNLSRSPWFQLSIEEDRSYLKALYPKVADKINGSEAGASENQFDRIARISVNLGMGATAMTGDSLAYQATHQLTWVKPEFYTEIEDEETQGLLEENFPEGVRLAFVGTTFCEAVAEKLEDHWSEVYAFPGDGAHRPSIGSPLVPVQERLNNLLDILYETYNHSIPWRWVASNKIDLNAIGDQSNLPGMTGQVEYSNEPISNYFFVEQQITVDASMLAQIKSLENEVAQLLTGAFPALFGGNTGSNDTASGISIQRDQALGRLGLIWRNIKSGYANALKLAVMVSASNRQGSLQTSLPGSKMSMPQSLKVDFDSLNIGKFQVHTDSDENFPESWTQKKNTFMLLMQSAEKNPAGFAASLMKDPNNVAYGKYMLGLSELTVPQEASRNKQLTEINELIKSEPQPNPQVVQAQQQLQAAQQKMTADANATAEHIQQGQQMLQQLQQQIAALPQEVSSVPIDAQYDDNGTEYQECVDWINSSVGQKLKLQNPKGFQNVRLHGLEHKAELDKAAANAQQAQGKPPSLSANVKDLPAPEAVAVLQKAGIPANIADFQAQAQADQAAQAARHAAIQ